MGIKGFQNFLKEQGMFTEYSKQDMRSYLQLVAGKTLYLDGPSFHNWLYSTLFPKSVYPRYNAYVSQIKRFNNTCEVLNITLVIVYDGMKRYALTEWHKRRKSSLQVLKRIISTESTFNIKIGGAGGLLEKYLKASTFKAHKDADSELVELALNDPNCGGIFSTDSDFSLVPGNLYWFTTNTFNGKVRVMYLPNLPGFNDQLMTGMIAAYGQHERAPSTLISAMKRYCKSYADVYKLKMLIESNNFETHKTFTGFLSNINDMSDTPLADINVGDYSSCFSGVHYDNASASSVSNNGSEKSIQAFLTSYQVPGASIYNDSNTYGTGLKSIQSMAIEFSKEFFETERHDSTMDSVLLTYYEENRLPSRVIDIIMNGEDFIDCIWFHKDVEWTNTINRRWYSIFVDKPVIFRGYVVETSSYTEQVLVPDRREMPFGGTYEQLIESHHNVRARFVSWVFRTNACNFFGLLWKTWRDKENYLPETPEISCALFITMLARLGRVKLDLPIEKAPRSIYPSVHRWLRHIQFLSMFNKLFNLWSVVTIEQLFDGDLFQNVYMSLCKGGKLSFDAMFNVISNNYRIQSTLQLIMPFVNVMS